MQSCARCLVIFTADMLATSPNPRKWRRMDSGIGESVGEMNTDSLWTCLIHPHLEKRRITGEAKTGMSSWTFLIGTETETNPVKRQGRLVSSTYLPFSVTGNHRHQGIRSDPIQIIRSLVNWRRRMVSSAHHHDQLLLLWLDVEESTLEEIGVGEEKAIKFPSRERVHARSLQPSSSRSSSSS